MKIFDFNIHLPFVKDNDVNVVIAQDMALGVQDLCKAIEIHGDKINRVDGGNFLLFNTQLFDEDPMPFVNKAKEYFSRTTFTVLTDFRSTSVFERIDQAAIAGVKAIMFNSYLQRISYSDFPELLKVCLYVQEKGLIICLDGGYGTSKMKVYDNLELACFVSENIQKTPIVIVHSGGYRVIEFFLLAADKRNVWLDTSFSLPYYIGSSIEKDYAFVYKKMQAKRIVFGTDFPYDNSDEALQIHLDFFARHNFTEVEMDRILFENACELFDI
jgi:predicted TIM-barrel fold metal-dependent hydrolase